MAVKSKTDRVAYLEWITDVTTMPYPDDFNAEPLKLAAMKPGAKWHQFRLFLIYAFTEHGRYGRRMFAAQDTLADEFDVSRPTVRKWLALAEALGLIRLVAAATAVRGTEYEIAGCGQNWAVSQLPVQQNGRFTDPWQKESPPW